MEKIVGQTLMWLSCINPCGAPSIEKSEEIILMTPMRVQEDISLSELLKSIEDTYNLALKSKSLTVSNRLHLIQIQTIVNKFKNKLDFHNQNTGYNITPALKILHDSLKADCIVWEQYHQENKISQQLYNQYNLAIQQFGIHSCTKAKVS